MTRPISILIAALGGEGGGVLAEWLVAVAAKAGYPAQSTSIPGVAQRTGATTYYIEVYPEPIAALGGRRPVLGLLPVPGCIDLVVASELLEAVRVIQSGMVSRDRTLLLTSTARTLTTAEKMPLGDGRFDSKLLIEVARDHSRKLAAFDMAEAARVSGTVVSAVMFGAIAASGVLPFARQAFEAVIGASDRGAQASRAGFDRAWDVIDSMGPSIVAGSTDVRDAVVEGAAAPPTDMPDAMRNAFPVATQYFVQLGYARLHEYQDRAYADLYLVRLKRVLGAEDAHSATVAHRFALTRETARFLALWMAFDDIVRVADLKCRAGRFARVRREVGAGERDIVRIVDYFKPGLPEFSSLLPPAMARRLATWDRRRQARGKGPLSMALTLATDSVAGFVVLRALAALRPLRRHGARFGQEQAAIEHWLGAIVAAAADDWDVAFEIAQCGRLIKGYGATNERGKDNLRHILDHLAVVPMEGGAAARASAIRKAREAALTDEGGKALDEAFIAHGAPPRPIRAQPILWAKAGQARRAPSVESMS